MKNAFVDTNILVYAADESPGESRKRTIARELLRAAGLKISVQVLNEFLASARSKHKLDLSPAAEKDWLSAWLAMEVEPLTSSHFLDALRIHHTYQLSHWDSLIVATALFSQADILYSEDMQHGQLIDGIRIINPFQEE